MEANLMSEMKVNNVPIGSITPYENNPRNNDDAVEATANSIKEFGWQQPIVVDKDNVIIVGHTRLKAAKSLGLDEVPVLVADNLSDEQVKAYSLADNSTGDLADWDSNLLISELSGIMNLDMNQFGFSAEADKSEEILDDDPYTMKVDVPQYQITGAEPPVEALYDDDKYRELKKDIDKAELPDEISEFLAAAATRHIKFNYADIAEYYAHADKKVQKLFENSALIIIDYDNALKNGYVQLSDRLNQMRIESKSDEDE